MRWRPRLGRQEEGGRGARACRRAWPAICAAALLVVDCAPATMIRVEVRSELPCDRAEAAVFVGHARDLATRAPSSTSASCVATDDETNLLGDLTLAPAGDADSEVAFTIAQRADGLPADDCLRAELAADARSQCIVARRELPFVPRNTLTVRVDLRRSCVGVVCPLEQTCVRGQCIGARLAATSCESVCGERTLDGGGPAAPSPGFGDPVTLASTPSSPGVLVAGKNGAFWGIEENGIPNVYRTLWDGANRGATVRIYRHALAGFIVDARFVDGYLFVLVRVQAGTTEVVALAGNADADAPPTGSWNLERGAGRGLAVAPQDVWVRNVDPTDNAYTFVRLDHRNGAFLGSTTVPLPLDGEPLVPMAAANRSLYWYSDGAIHELVAGSMAPTALAIPTDPVAAAVATGTALYWSTTAGAIFRRSLAGGPAAAVRLVDGVRDAGRLAVDGAFVYWGERATPGAPGRIAAVPAAGGAPLTVLAGADPLPNTLSVGDDGLYWADGARGEIRMLPRSGRP